jgi:hypothetical protein
MCRIRYVIAERAASRKATGKRSGGGREAQRAVGDFTFRMTRPLKRPMRVALADHLTGFNPCASQAQPSATGRF